MTIPDIDVVVDSGRERQARYVERYLQTQLITRMIPLASAEQRAGRAGRVRSGRCYRVWSESQQQGFAKFSEPALATENLASAVLEAAAWGAFLPQLPWFTPPPTAAVQRALQQLQRLGLVAPTDTPKETDTSAPGLTAKGKAVQQLGTDLQVGCMLHVVMTAKDEQLASHGALLAAHLGEQEWRGSGELTAGLAELLRNPKGYPRTHRRYRYWCKRLRVQSLSSVDPDAVVELGLALEPYWLAKRRDSGEHYQLATGVAATLPTDFTERPEWLLVTGMTLSEGRSDGVIRQGIAVPWAHISAHLDQLSRTESRWFWRGSQGRLRRQVQRKIGVIVVAESESDASPSADEFNQAMMSAMVSDPGLGLFNKPPVEQFLRRVQLAAEQLDCYADDWQPQALLDRLAEWAAFYVRDCRTLNQARQWNPLPALQAHLGYQETKTLDKLLPHRWQAPSGRSHDIYYDEHGAAVVRLKLQEVFGEPSTPRILEQKLPLTFELLSPAGRPLQRTQDLASFWQDGYPLVRKEMRGRYPKHPWPEDPVQAIASHKTKRALEQ